MGAAHHGQVIAGYGDHFNRPFSKLRPSQFWISLVRCRLLTQVRGRGKRLFRAEEGYRYRNAWAGVVRCQLITLEHLNPATGLLQIGPCRQELEPL